MVALCGWGLRTGEVVALHVNQLVLDGDDPHVYFEEGERKSNSDRISTVAIIHGIDEVNARIDDLVADTDDWNGYLFPSGSSASGHVDPGTIRRRWYALVQRADVRVHGEHAKPKMARRWWYSAFSDAVDELIENLEDIADEQGSTDAGVVRWSYLDEESRHRERRRVMRDRLEDAFARSN